MNHGNNLYVAANFMSSGKHNYSIRYGGRFYLH